MVQFLSIIFVVGFLQFLLGFSKVPFHVSFCIILYFARFLIFRIASTHMGAPYVRIWTTAPP